MKYRKRLLIIIFTLLLTIIGGTFAWYTYSSKESALVLTIGDINDTRITVNPYQVRETVVPVNVYTSGVVSQVEVINNSSTSVAISFYYKINELSEDLINNGLKYTITSSDNLDGNYTEVLTGDFTDYENGMVTIYEEKLSKVKITYYKIYLWLDSNYGDQSNLQNLSLDVELNATIYHEAAKPELDDGMIPVTIEDDGAVITIDEDNPEWYNYSQQEWANMVLVTEASRSSYVGTEDKEINQDDILAYYVWIPRYKYKIWTTGVSSAGSEQTIDIIFEDKYAPVVKGTSVGDYRTHPAFIWDGDTVSGIWVGKFETTPDKSSTCYSTPSVANCNNTTQNPTVLPNEASLRYQYVGNQFATSQRISMNGNIYGLSNTLTDAHMMKNSEWGAAAYLSHSQYGINGEIRLNNYWNETDNKYTLTGCGAATSTTTSTVTTCSIAYGSGVSEYPQSTTGNITGVFDMSGGAWDFVMGNYGNTTYSTYIPTLPDTKYYDLYSSTQFTDDWKTNLGLCTLETCGGHALNEIAGWYNDLANFVGSGVQWFLRGGAAPDGSVAGAVAFSYDNGGGSSYSSWRSVLIKEPYREEILNGADPDLDKGMIPVTIADDGIVTTSSIYDSNWYSYEDKEWANAILVTDESRDKYFENVGVVVSEEDILAYYVWIPRYKYEIWTTGVSSTGSEQTINIVFEDADTEMSLGTTVGSYRTHPAFWWDDDSDGIVDFGETVDGIWVGKFETTGDASTPTIKPNLSSIRSQNVSAQFATSQKFTVENNIYGLSNTFTNGHMMKNSEWGAVAYLSHSEYGINQEIYINNSSEFYTGRSGGNVGGNVNELATQFPGFQTATTQYNSYGYYTWIGQSINSTGTINTGEVTDITLGTYASTTGNVTGVYDMSGGAWEYVMGNYGRTVGLSGFTTMPASKYFDVYLSTQFYGNEFTNINLCTLEACGGHALFETRWWYSDDGGFVTVDLPWSLRFGLYSGSYYVGEQAGVFSAGYGSGGYDYDDVSWRSVLVVGFGE